MKKCKLTNSLEKVFSIDRISKELLYDICKTKDTDEIVYLLFSFLNEELKCFYEKDLSFLINVLDTITDITIGENIYLQKIVRKTYENIVEILQTGKNGYNQESEKNLLILKNKLLYLDDIDIASKQVYESIISIIEWHKNLKYLQIILNKYPKLANIKDSNGVSLYSNIILKYIEIVKKVETDEEQLNYYNSVLLTIRLSPEFSLDGNEIAIIKEKIKQSLKSLDKNNQYYSYREKLLNNMCNYNLENIHINELMKKYSININFSNDLLSELDKYHLNLNSNDRIYIKDYSISIDKMSSYELDDALTIRKLNNGNYLLGVHIANVLGYFPYDSELVRNAINKGSNIYLTKNRSLKDNKRKSEIELIPIFPLIFSSKNGSLLEHQKRLANSYFFELDSSANIVNYRFLKTVINVNNNSNYDTINRIIKKGSRDKLLENNVNLLNELTYKLEDKYKKTINEKKFTRAELIIELTTRLTNQVIANYFYENSYPFLYRIHELKKEPLIGIQNDLSILRSVYGDQSINKLFGNLKNICDCRYDTFGVHEGLNGIHYTHATAPLRRGSDIVVEHALDVCYFNKPTDKELYNLELDINEKKNILNISNETNEKFLKEYYMLSSCNKSVKKLKK